MPDYDDGHSEGYRVGPYGVTPQGTWAADAYQDPRATASLDYRDGMRDGRADRIGSMGDAAYDPDARQNEALEAWQVYQQQTGGGDG